MLSGRLGLNCVIVVATAYERVVECSHEYEARCSEHRQNALQCQWACSTRDTESTCRSTHWHQRSSSGNISLWCSCKHLSITWPWGPFVWSFINPITRVPTPKASWSIVPSKRSYWRVYFKAQIRGSRWLTICIHGVPNTWRSFLVLFLSKSLLLRGLQWAVCCNRVFVVYANCIIVGLLCKLYCALQEWASGCLVGRNFDEATYKPLYHRLLRQLKETSAGPDEEKRNEQKETMNQISDYCM